MFTMYNLLRNNGTFTSIRQLSSYGFCFADLFFLDEKVFQLSEREKSYFIQLREMAESYDINEELLDSIYFLGKYNVPILVLHQLYQLGITTISELKKYLFTRRKELNISQKQLDKIMDVLPFIEIADEEKFIMLTLIWVKNHHEPIHQYYHYISKFMSLENAYILLNRALEKKYFVIENARLMLNAYTIDDLKTIQTEDVKLFMEKMQGYTLQEIGDKRGITRERVRQKLNKILTLIGNLKHDEYQKIFETYHLTSEDFKILFNESDEVYQYLHCKYTKGMKDHYHLLNEYHFPKEVVTAILKNHHLIYDYKKQLVPLNYANVFANCLFKHRNQMFSLETIRKSFFKELIKYFPEEEANQVSIRGVAERSSVIIFNDTNCFRFFEPEITEKTITLVNQITNLEDGLYGCKKIFNENKLIMKQLGLKNGNEFCDFCSRFVGLEKLRFVKKIHRRSEIQIGDVSKYTFVENYLLNHINKKVYDVVTLFSKKYGLNRNSMYTYIGIEFSHLICGNYIRLQDEDSDVEEIVKYINTNCNEMIYGLKRFYNILKPIFGISKNHINHLLLKNTNYEIDSEIVYLKQFKTVFEAIRQAVKQRKIIYFNDENIPKNTTVYSVFRKLEQNLEVFKINSTQFVAAEKIYELGIDESLIKHFMYSIHKFSKKYVVFTFECLLHNGFDHPLLKYNLDPYFYERLITLIPNIIWTKTKPHIFTFETDKHNLPLIIDFLVEMEDVNSINELSHLLKNKFKISIPKNKLRQHAKSLKDRGLEDE